MAVNCPRQGPFINTSHTSAAAGLAIVRAKRKENMLRIICLPIAPWQFRRIKLVHQGAAFAALPV